MEAFAEEASRICGLYQQAQALHAQGFHLVSTDEKTGMQALERKHPTKPTRPGLVERREFEYIRHGTRCLMANLEVATGRIVAPSIGPTRTEADFARHIEQTIETDPGGSWIFVVDGLNTHMSEALVRLVAQHCRLDQALGQKGKNGILASMASRRRFLESASHRIRFVYGACPRLRSGAEALLVVKSGGDLVFDLGPAPAQAGQFRLGRGVGGARVEFHRVLQPGVSQAVQVELHRPPASRINLLITSAHVY